ncbi:acyltransferase [Salinibacterium sp.]|uniref:acyltransferase family protein n=1 Tax=Salinibacterium sp. TaxID=1915057 RepID=UPI00286D35F6|nr:acyltransferase [Salinibacterium sp.]
MTSTSATLTRTPRLDALTGLRWWAAFAVFLYHILIFAPLPSGVSAILGQGYMGVTFFFVLSGFVLTWSMSPSLPRSTFYWRRFARIYPSHLIALLLAIPVFYQVWPWVEPLWRKPFEPGVLSLSFPLLQGWSTDPHVLFSGNPAAWTLTCEFFFYALHPFIAMALTRFDARGAVLFGIAAIVIAFSYRLVALTHPDLWFSDLPPPIVRLPDFVAGMAVAWAFRQGWRPKVPVLAGMVSLGLVTGLIAVTSAMFPESGPVMFVVGFGNEFMTIACAVVIVAITRRALEGRRSIFASRAQIKLGEWSFAFYLVHATAIYLALTLFGLQEPSWRNLVWFAVLGVVALAAAAALHTWVERPVERRMRAWKDRRDAARPTGAGFPRTTQSPQSIQ